MFLVFLKKNWTLHFIVAMAIIVSSTVCAANILSSVQVSLIPRSRRGIKPYKVLVKYSMDSALCNLPEMY